MNAGEIAVIAWGLVGFVGIVVFAIVVIKQHVDIKIHGAPNPDPEPEARLDEPNDGVGDGPPRNPR